MAKVDIANKALTYLGEETILTFNDDTDIARVINIHYDSCKRHLLTSHNWCFAMLRAPFVEIANHTDTKYQYAFQIPSNCLKIIASQDKCLRWKRFGDQVWTTANEFTAEYIHECPEDLFSAPFEKALQYYISSQVAMAINGSSTVRDASYQMYMEAAREAIEANDTEQGYLDFEEEPGEHIRRGFGRGVFTRDY